MIDDVLQIGPIDGLRDAPAVDEHRGRAGDRQILALLHLRVHLRLRALAIDARAQVSRASTSFAPLAHPST